MNSKQKKTIIEGWLKKVKEKAKSKTVGNTNKRWFALDIVNAVFTYANGKNKKASKTIPLRDIIDFVEPEDSTGKEWDNKFAVITREREYYLFAQTKNEKEMWAHAFRTILKYKYKEKEQHKEPTPDPQLDMGEEKDGFSESEGEDHEEEKYDRREQSDEEDRGDFMTANAGHLAHSKAKPKPDQKEDRHFDRRAPDLEDSDDTSSDEESPKTNSKKERLKIGEKMRQEMQTQEQEFRKKLNPQGSKKPTSKKQIKEAEIIEDEDADLSDEDHSEEEGPNREQKKEQRYSQKEKMVKDSRDRKPEPEVNLNIDEIVKKSGPKETIKLEMPTPKIEEKKDEPLPYFNGFLPKPQGKDASKPKLDLQPNPPKQKKVIKVNKIKKKDNEDLLSRWDKKYGVEKKQIPRDEWGNEIHSDQQREDQPPQIVEKPKPEVSKKEYVENILAHQNQANGGEFEDNWDDEEGSPIREAVDSTKYQKFNKENTKYRHPDIPMDKISKRKSKKKGKKKVKVIKNNNQDMVQPAQGGGEFDMNWDD